MCPAVSRVQVARYWLGHKSMSAKRKADRDTFLEDQVRRIRTLTEQLTQVQNDAMRQSNWGFPLRETANATPLVSVRNPRLRRAARHDALQMAHQREKRAPHRVRRHSSIRKPHR